MTTYSHALMPSYSILVISTVSCFISDTTNFFFLFLSFQLCFLIFQQNLCYVTGNLKWNPNLHLKLQNIHFPWSYLRLKLVVAIFFSCGKELKTCQNCPEKSKWSTFLPLIAINMKMVLFKIIQPPI